jgi:hypothetical protein
MAVRSRELERQLDEVRSALRDLFAAAQDINIKVERLDATIVTRDPGNARSAEEFAGLRKTIVQASTQRRQHVSHLVSLLGDIDAGGSSELLRLRVTDFLAELGVIETSIEEWPDAFDAADETETPRVAIIQDLGDGAVAVLRRGRAPLDAFQIQESEVTDDPMSVSNAGPEDDPSVPDLQGHSPEPIGSSEEK